MANEKKRMTAKDKRELRSRLVRENCETMRQAVYFKLTQLTVLHNACTEAANWRREHGMAQADLYEQVRDEIIEKASRLLERRIEDHSDRMVKLQERGRVNVR